MKRTREILEKVDALPPFPTVIHKVLSLLQDPLVSAEHILEAVRFDQSITANVLKVCNSALLGGARRVSSLKDALVRIGNKPLIRVILSAGGSDVLQKEVPGYDMERGALWRHSVLCALLCESLSDVIGYGRKDKAFTAGLLHDVGKVVLSEFVGKEYGKIRDAAMAANFTFLDAESGILGVNHAEAGGRIGEKWNFDAELVNAIRHHHDPAKGEAGPLLFLVHLSDVLCLTSGIGGGADGLRYNVDHELLKSHGIGSKEFELGMIRLADVEHDFRGIVAMYG
ncbi:MAG: HDOD domain-containing protein [Candidatus Deferrimicrobiaceae bacterium]